MQLLTICINVNILQATHVAYLMGKRNARCVTSNYDSINIGTSCCPSIVINNRFIISYEIYFHAVCLMFVIADGTRNVFLCKSKMTPFVILNNFNGRSRKVQANLSVYLVYSK